MTGTSLPSVLLALQAAPNVGGLLTALVPELLLLAGLLVILCMETFGSLKRNLAPRITLGVVLAALIVSYVGMGRGDVVEAGPLRVDDMARLFRLIFNAAGALTLVYAMREGAEWFDQAEFHVLFLASLTAMSVLSASVDILTAYLAFEMLSYTGYLMVGYVKADVRASEAGLKYVVFGSVCSGAMLFGLTLLFGIAGSTSMDTIASVLVVEGASPAAVVASVLVLAGIGFKVSAVPFHFWAPDAYDGATTAVAGFLAVASKAAGFAILVRILGTWVGAAHGLPDGTQFGFLPSGPLPYWLLGVAAILTMVAGNTAALLQGELKRLMAWSSVAHAGYMLMALASGNGDAIGGVLFYFWVYLLMTVGAFGIIGMLKGPLGGTHVHHYNGLSRRNPVLAISLAVLMISLTGLPPTLGFWGKVMLFKPVIEHGYHGLAVVGLLMSAVSLFYYAFLLRAMFLQEPASDAGELRLPMMDWVLVQICCAPLLLMGLFGWWSGASAMLKAANDWVAVALQ